MTDKIGRFYQSPVIGLMLIHHLQQISSWMTANLLILNSSKTELLLQTTTSQGNTK